MRYSKDHKAATHAKIVQNASVQLRERGARGVGVADLMKDVGLTHGGFYAHFESRDDLVNEAIAAALDQNTAMWREAMDGKPVEARAPALANEYLSSRHRDNPSKGCALASLAVDVSRESSKTRRIFLNKFDRMVNLMASEDGRPAAAKARQKALAAISTMMGALVLARVAGNGALSEEILEAGRSAVLNGGRAHPLAKPVPRKRAVSAAPKRGRAPELSSAAERRTSGQKRTQV